MPITVLKYPRAKFSFQINWALQHMIKIHNSDEGASSLLKISLSEKERKNCKRKKNSLARLSQEKNEMRDNYIY
jgi:hypothetical protein